MPKRKNINVIGLRKDELGQQIIKEFEGLRACCYFKENNDENKKAKGTKTCVIKRELKMKQGILLENILDFSNKSRPRSKTNIKKKTKHS